MKLKKILTFVMVASAIFLLGACGNSDEESRKKTEETPEVEKENKAEETMKQEVEKELKIVEVKLRQRSNNELNVVSTAEGEKLSYAFYVIKDGEIYERFGYTGESTFDYTVTEPGEYKVRSYVKDKDGNKLQKDTKKVEITF